MFKTKEIQKSENMCPVMSTSDSVGV